MIAVLVAVVVALACAGYGAAILKLFRITAAGTLETSCLRLGLGFGFLAMTLFWVGIAGGLWRSTFILLTAPAAALGAWSLFLDRRRAGVPVTLPPGQGLATRLLMALSVICAAANLMGAFAPPSFIDALVYHLLVPQQFLLQHAIVELPVIWQQYQPMAVEMLYMVALALGSAKGASLLCAGTGLLAAAGTYLLGARLAGPVAGLLAVAIFYDNPMVAWESTSCFLELAIAALGSLGIHALLVWDGNRQRRWLVISALLLGFAGSCKLNAASLVVVGVLLILYLSLRSGDGLRVALLRLVGFGLVASAPIVPWMIRAWILTGNPVYPFATPLFGANPDRAPLDWVFAHYGVGYSLLDRLLAPWNLFTQGGMFENGNYLSPIPMLMAPVIVIRAFQDRRQRTALLAASLGIVAIWSAGGGHVARYLVMGQPLLGALAADALCWLATFGGRRRLVAVATASLFLLFGTAGTVVYAKQFAPVAFGQESDEVYLRRNSWYYDTFRQVCDELPAGGRLLTNTQTPTFYLNCPHASARDIEFADPARLRQIILGGHFTDLLLLGNEALEARVANLGADVKLVWKRQEQVMARRILGLTASHSVALFHVVRPGYAEGSPR